LAGTTTHIFNRVSVNRVRDCPNEQSDWPASAGGSWMERYVVPCRVLTEQRAMGWAPN